jgi:glycosyltransferase involved in cell wall biosynthesis
MFAYNRADKTKRCIESLSKCQLADESNLYVYSDGAADNTDAEKVREVRDVLQAIKGFRSTVIIERDKNMGLSKSVIAGVTQVLELHDSLIVVEDDLVFSDQFLTFMNEGLERFRLEPRVISIQGYVPQFRQSLDGPFFLRRVDSWGWATWRDRWQMFESDAKALQLELKSNGLIKEFDLNGFQKNYQMLSNQVDGLIDSWAIRWQATCFLRNKLSLYPPMSLVQNLGFDGSGRHCGISKDYDVHLSNHQVKFASLPVQESRDGRRAYMRFQRNLRRSIFKRIGRKMILLLQRPL